MVERPRAAWWLAAWVAAALLTGCQTWPGRTTDTGTGAAVADPSAETFQGLVHYAQWLRQRAPETLAGTRDEAEQRAADSGTAADRLRLALVLSVPGTGFRDEPRARALVDDVMVRTQDQDTGMHAFATLLATNLSDRQWVRERLQRRLSSERQRRKWLERKLEELKDIEQQLDRRDGVDTGTAQ